MRYLFSIVLCFFITAAFSQSVEKKIAASLDTLAELYPLEKVYLQTDKEQYVAGETVWFKAYVALENKPSFLSKVVYVELVNERNQLVEKRMYKVDNGAAAGEIVLKEKTAGGTYALNAYTMWMLNFPKHVYTKHLFIYNADVKKTASDASKTVVQFFPEGGKMLAGKEGVVAFKATGENGLPVEVAGEILDSKKVVVTKFTTSYQGMGSVIFTPAAGEKYTAIVTLPNRSTKSFTLPDVAVQGISLAVTNLHPTKVFVRVDRAEQNKAENNDLIVAAVLNQQLVYIGKLNIDEGLDAASVSKKNLPAGLLHILVLNKAGNLLSERRVFISNFQNTSILKPQSIQKGKRVANTIQLDLPSKKHTLSLLASDVNAQSGETSVQRVSENILSGLLLSSELDGYLHRPAAYFKDTSVATLKALDLLMLTTTSSRFDYGKVVNMIFPKLNFIVESGISVKGKAVKPGTTNVLKSGKINLWIKGEDSTSIIADAQLTEKGLFYIPDLDFRKSAKIFYQGTSAKREGALVEVLISPSYFDTLKTAHAKPAVDLNPYFDPVLSAAADKIVQKLTAKNNADVKVLQEIKITAKKKSVVDSLNQEYVSDLFINSDQSFAPDSNVNYADMWQLLRSKLGGLTINRTDTGTEVNFTRYANLSMFSTEPGASVQFFLNEVPVTNDVIEFLDPNDVAYVKSYAGVSGIALGVTRGAVGIYTKKGKSLRDWRAKGFDAVTQSGYSTTTSFPVPDYKNITTTEVPDDRRATLLWQPNLKTTKPGKAEVKFYTNDNGGNIRLVLEGFDAEGRLYFEEVIL